MHSNVGYVMMGPITFKVLDAALPEKSKSCLLVASETTDKYMMLWPVSTYLGKLCLML